MTDRIMLGLMIALAAISGILGLILASRALDDAIYGFGLGLFAFAVLYVMWVLSRPGRPGAGA